MMTDCCTYQYIFYMNIDEAFLTGVLTYLQLHFTFFPVTNYEQICIIGRVDERMSGFNCANDVTSMLKAKLIIYHMSESRLKKYLQRIFLPFDKPVVSALFHS